MNKNSSKKNIHIPRLVYIGIVAILLLAGCSPKLRTSGREVREKGNASYYGDKFHGRPTASGERFNQKAMTAAHRTLPFGTKVTVKNLNNGKQVVVRINDRGPSSKSRAIDLSKGAAKKIGMIQAGVVPVELRYNKEVASRKKIKTKKRGK
ncbi:MAG TPA: septal ring lytic transglycosylase RlpA family protein [Sphingobacterium sp.]|nr:septal ring lytic transglycosylase RlpA family protein [Sphingobacterium sp.]